MFVVHTNKHQNYQINEKLVHILVSGLEFVISKKNMSFANYVSLWLFCALSVGMCYKSTLVEYKQNRKWKKGNLKNILERIYFSRSSASLS